MTGMLAASLCLLGTAILRIATPVLAQSPGSPQVPDSPEVVRRTVDVPTRLFAVADVPAGTRGLRIRLPGGVSLDEVAVLQYGARSQPVTVTNASDGSYLVEAEQELRGPHDIVARVTLPRTGQVQWSIQPLALRNAPGASGPDAPSLTVDNTRPVGRRFEQTIQVDPEPPLPDTPNQVLAFRERLSSPVILDAQQIPPFERSVSFTAEFWMATTGLDEIVLSTWTGEEDRNYPLEMVVDAAGRIRFYCGQPGRHTSMSSIRPLADGTWHHVAVAYHGEQRALRLMVDGVAVDSVEQVSLPGGYLRPDLAVGGRLPPANSTGRVALFSGYLDVLRLWNVARSPSEVRQTMREEEIRQESEEERSRWTREAEQVITFTFDEPPPAEVVRRWPREAERVASTLRLRRSLHDLRASMLDGQVELRWRSDATGVKAFIVERATRGTSFEEVRRLTPEDAEPTSRPGERLFTTTDEPTAQVVYYRIREVYAGGTDRVSGTFKVGVGPREPEPASGIVGNYPNPFSGKTTIEFELDEPAAVRLTLWDVSGKRLAVILDQSMSAGQHRHTLSSRDLPSGTYFVRLEADNASDSHQIVVLR